MRVETLKGIWPIMKTIADSSAKRAVPFYRWVRVATEGGHLILYAVGEGACDQIRVWYNAGPVTGALPEGGVFVELKSLEIACNGSKHVDLEAAADAASLWITDADGDVTELSAESSGDVPSELFALPPTVAPVDLVFEQTGQDILERIAWVSRASSMDLTRPHLVGVQLTGEVLVATDGHRLHVAPCLVNSMPVGGIRFDPKVVECLSRIKDFTGVIVDKGFVRVQAGPWTFVTTRTLSESRFPPWDKVVPQKWREERSLEVETARCMKALSKCRKASGEDAIVIRATAAEAEIQISPQGAAKLSCRVALTQPNNCVELPNIKLGVNALYLLEALSGKISRLHLTGDQKTSMIMVVPNEPAGCYGAIMPMRL